ncbi:MAG TPA: SCO family protein [Candidatus Kapabacteria bacterium]|nr:SCO family protein [Candidatus Kapabacteria bacterium]
MTPHTTQRLLWGVLAVSLLLIGGFSFVKWEKSDVRLLEDYGTLPEFSLLDQSGARVSLQTFEGHIWVADMIFTHCGSICPTLTAKMLALESALKDEPDVRFASVTVDPRHDTPDTLRAYAAAHHADTTRWTFLTGPIPAIYTLIKGGFHLPLDSVGGDQRVPIIHSPRFALVDARGHIRGYYNGEQPGAQTQILSDIGALQTEAGQ